MPRKKRAWTAEHHKKFEAAIAARRDQQVKHSPAVVEQVGIPLDSFRTMDGTQLQRFVEIFPRAATILIRHLLG